MRKYVFSCDICGKEKEGKELKQLEIKSRDITFIGSSYGRNFDICTDCLTEKGFKLNNKENDESKHNTKTIEDKLVEILQDLNIQFYE